MLKRIQELFAIPPPTTYEIEAKNLKPPSYGKQQIDNSTSNDSKATADTVEASATVENSCTNKRKERSYEDTDEIPHKKAVIADPSADPIPHIKTESTEMTLPQFTESPAVTTVTSSAQIIKSETSEHIIKTERVEQVKNSLTPEAIPFVSPLDIILGTVNLEKLNALERASPSPMISTPPFAQSNSPSPSVATPPPSNRKRSRLEYNKKRKEKKRAEADYIATMNHADQPNVETREKDENDLFSEFEALKAKKELAAQQQPKQKKKKQANKKQGNKNQQQQGNHNQNQRPQPVSSDTLPDYHLPNENNFTQKPFVPRKDCVYFLKGNCHAGDKCRFKHESPVGVAPAPPPAPPTVVCQFFKTGACALFDNCKFSHDLKIEPCRFFHMSGKCEQGDGCPYSHEPLNDDRLRRLRSLTGPCRFYHFKGYCSNPDTCMFSHDEASADQLKEVESTIKPCRFYHIFQNCSKGDDCFYSHAEATPLQIQQLRDAEKKKPKK
ncbi:unnamed protein product [Mucor hiemalis]